VVTVRKAGFIETSQPVALRSNLPLEITITLPLEGVFQEVSVTAFDKVQLVDVEATGTRTQLNLEQIEKMPTAVEPGGWNRFC